MMNKAKLELMQAITKIHDECKEANWDGYGAEPVSAFSCTLASSFIYFLSDELMLPDPIPEPSGNIGLIWEKENKVIILSFSHLNGSIEYLARIDGQIYKGTHSIYTLPIQQEFLNNFKKD